MDLTPPWCSIMSDLWSIVGLELLPGNVNFLALLACSSCIIGRNNKKTEEPEWSLREEVNHTDISFME